MHENWRKYGETQNVYTISQLEVYRWTIAVRKNASNSDRFIRSLYYLLQLN